MRKKKNTRVDEKQLQHLPLSFVLDDGVGVVECQSLLRYLPKRRVVYEALWCGRKVVCKVFLHRRAKLHQQREIRGSRVLFTAHILSPRLLHAGTAGNGAVRLVIYNYLENGRALSAFIPGPQAVDYITKAIAVLAQCQIAGLHCDDIHLDNFYVVGDFLYLLDAASIRKKDTTLSIETGLRELAVLLSVCEMRDEAMLFMFFKAYVEARRCSVKERYFILFKKLIERRKEKLLQIVMKKVYRTCTRMVWQHKKSYVSAYERAYESEALTTMLVQPESFISANAIEVLKAGNTCTVFRALLNGRAIAIKRYNIKNHWHGMKRLFQRSRADCSWYAAHLLTYYRIATPRPIAMIEQRVGPFRRRAYYLSEFLPGCSLKEALCSNTLPVQSQRRLVSQVMHIFRELNAACIVHGDMKATNFHVSDGEIYLIDLDAMRRYPSRKVFLRHQARDVYRFMKNWEGNPLLQEAFRDVWMMLK